jgi:hypothetical protein
VGVLIIVVELFVRLGGRRLPFNVGGPTEGLEDLEELLELVEDDEVRHHHAEPEPPEALAEVLDCCESRFLAEPVDERLRNRSIACASEVKQGAYLYHERLGEFLHASQHLALASGLDLQTPSPVLDQLEALF